MTSEHGTASAARPLSPAELDLIEAWVAGSQLLVGRPDLPARQSGCWSARTSSRGCSGIGELVSDVIDRVPKLG